MFLDLDWERDLNNNQKILKEVKNKRWNQHTGNESIMHLPEKHTANINWHNIKIFIISKSIKL